MLTVHTESLRKQKPRLIPNLCYMSQTSRRVISATKNHKYFARKLTRELVKRGKSREIYPVYLKTTDLLTCQVTLCFLTVYTNVY